MEMKRPRQLYPGDKVATITLSWGGAGELPDRYLKGKSQLENVFGLKVVETKHALMPADYIYKNPQARAEDLMEAFSDNTIKAIITNVGGEDSIRILPYLDLNVIRDNPKIFLGMSDDTITHMACYRAGVTSFYGTSVMAGFAENGGMHRYQIDDILSTLFSSEAVGVIKPSDEWTSEFLDWGDSSLNDTRRKLNTSAGWNFLQGEGRVQGRLLGGCVEVLDFLKGTDYWPGADEWDGRILFLETSEEMMPPSLFRRVIRNYAAQGIFDRISGLIMGRPYNNQYTSDYNEILTGVIREELGINKLTIITEMDFGHTSPVFTLPYGAMAEIDNDSHSFAITEPGVSL